MHIDGRLDYFMRVVDVGETGRRDDGDGGRQEVKRIAHDSRESGA